jgi:hypothetical protein
MGLSAIKNDARLAIHGRMGEPCTYSLGDESFPTVEQIAAGLELTARFHTKAKLHMSDGDGPTLMEPIEKLVFNITQLEALGLVLEHNAEIHFPGYDVTVILDQPLDGDGPQNAYWTVTRA